MQNLPSPLRRDVLDDAAQRVARGGIQNPLAYLLATLRKAQAGEFNQYRRGKAAVPEFVPPVVSEPEIPARLRQKRDISKLVAEIRAQCLGVADVVTALEIPAHMFIKTVFIDIWSEHVDGINIFRSYV